MRPEFLLFLPSLFVSINTSRMFAQKYDSYYYIIHWLSNSQILYWLLNIHFENYTWSLWIWSDPRFSYTFNKRIECACLCALESLAIEIVLIKRKRKRNICLVSQFNTLIYEFREQVVSYLTISYQLWLIKVFCFIKYGIRPF